MKNTYLLLLLLLSCALQAQDGVFVENKGQWDARAKFRMSLPSGYAFLESSAITYKIFHPDALPDHPHPDDGGVVASRSSDEPSEVVGHVLRAKFLNSQSPTPHGEDMVRTKYNFFLGDNQANWASGASAYHKVHYTSLYPNIDLELYLNYSNLKYDLVVQPNGNPADISFVYEGNEGIEIQNGRLRVHTNFNVLEEQVPIAYQYINGEKVEVLAQFVLHGETVGFDFPEGYNTDFPLIIDPELVFSTYSGSTQNNWGFTATYDEEGHAYTAGLTVGEGQFPTTPGVIIRNPTSDPNDASFADIGILKFSPEGDELIYATYLGGANTDLPHSLLVNNQNQLIVLGSTGSSNFPTTTGAFDRTFNGGNGFQSSINMVYSEGSDIFITVLNENATSLVGSTYLGGSDNDGLDLTGFGALTKNYGDQFRGDLQVDDSGNIYLVSTTSSANFPTRNAFQATYQGGQDGVICSFNANLSALRWSTFMGGSEQDGVFSVRLNKQGQLAVCGGTNSNNFPIAGNPLNSTLAGDVDGFVGLVSANGSLLASSYLGTPAYDQAFLLDTDENDNVVVFGQTQGGYPVSSGVYSNPNSGQFLHKLTPDLSATVFSTVFGSQGTSDNISVNIRPTAFVVSDCGSMLLSGWGGNIRPGEHLAADTRGLPTTSDNIPATSTTSAGDDFYLMILSSDGRNFVYGTYLGGQTSQNNLDHVDGGTSRFDKNGIVYQAVCVCRDNGFPATPNAFSTANAADGGCNNVVYKFDLRNISAQINPNVIDDATGEFVDGDEGCADLEVLFTPDGILGSDLRWDFGDGATATQGSPADIVHTYTEPGVYIVTLESADPVSCERLVTAQDTITVYDSDFDISPSVEICSGESTTLMASGSISYQWAADASLSSTNTATTVATPTETTTYQVFLENEQGCQDTLSTTVAITTAQLELKSEYTNACGNLPEIRVFAELSPQNPLNWQLDGEPLQVGASNSYDFFPSSTGQYTFSVDMEYSGCPFSDELVLDVAYNEIGLAFQNATAGGGEPICEGDTLTLSASEGFFYEWTPAEGLNNTNTASVLAFPTQTTEYIVKISNGIEECFVERKVPVEVFPKVRFDIQYDFQYECSAYPQLIFTNNSTGASEYLWYWGGDLFNSTDAPPPYIPSQSGVQNLKVEGGNTKCSGEFSVDIEIPDIVLPPNVITPNGDGKNDTFIIYGIQGWIVQIYNRWGKLVYETDDYQNDWEGRGEAGETFYYLLTAPDGTTCKGWLQVLGD